MIGKIYKITNKLNGKVYIGKTTYPLQTRFQQHCYNSQKINTYFYNDIKKYGIENFEIDLLEEVDINNLSEREVFYIKQFDSFNFGYNSTLGGEGVTKFDISVEQILAKYIELKSFEKVANCFGCCRTTIWRKLVGTNYKSATTKKGEGKGCKTPYGVSELHYSTHWKNKPIFIPEIKRSFPSLILAAEYIKPLTKTTDIKNILRRIREILNSTSYKKSYYGLTFLEI